MDQRDDVAISNHVTLIQLGVCVVTLFLQVNVQRDNVTPSGFHVFYLNVL